MKSVPILVVALALALLPACSGGHEGHAHGVAEAAEMEGHVHGGHAGGVQTVKGEVVDLACYLSEGASGAAHQACAQKCIGSGVPVGIKTADGLYVAVSSQHGPANKDLAPLAGKQVEAEGTVSERDGIRLIALNKVTPKE